MVEHLPSMSEALGFISDTYLGADWHSPGVLALGRDSRRVIFNYIANLKLAWAT